MVTASLHLAAFRNLGRHPWQTLLCVLGVALGVAVVVAVDLANQSARRAFDLSLETLTGRATHQLVGGPTGLDEALYRRLKLETDFGPSAPMVEGLVEFHGETLRLLGVDPLAEPPFRRYTGDLRGAGLGRLLTEPGTVLMAASTARRHGLSVDDDMQLAVAGRMKQAHIIGLLDAAPGEEAALDGLIVADISTAQELLGRIGRLDHIDLRLDDEAARNHLSTWLPPGITLVATEARGDALKNLTRAFHINLTAMSLLALVVGGFLIYNAMTFSVLQRRTELATLRLIGTTRSQIMGLVLLEAGILGVAGSLLGVAAGLALGSGLLSLVTRTINDLYFVLNVTGLSPRAGDLLKGLALGLGTSLLAAAGPAFEAGRVSPLTAQRRSSLERTAHRAAPWVALAGAVIAGLGWALQSLPSRSLVLGFVALFLLIVGISLAVPMALLVISKSLQPLLSKTTGAIGRLAVSGIAGGLSRAGLAVAALTVAVSATVGVAVMITSFRTTVADWLGQTLQADLYVSSPAAVSERASGTLPADLATRLAALPGVAAISAARPVTVESGLGPLELLALDVPERARAGTRFKQGDPAQAWPALEAGRGVFVSEPLAYHHKLAPGDILPFETGRGRIDLPVLGVFYDYASTRGMAIMDRGLYEALWADPTVSSIGVYLAPESSLETTLETVRRAVAGFDEQILVRANREIREASLAVFDRTFAITHVLRLLVVGVAFVGVLSALLALQLEHSREHALLRATGITPAGLLGMVSLQTLVMGLTAGLLALPLGLLMAEVLLDVINRWAFGWSLASQWPPGVLFEALWLATAAALLAGLYPALRMGRVQPAAALREE